MNKTLDEFINSNHYCFNINIDTINKSLQEDDKDYKITNNVELNIDSDEVIIKNGNDIVYSNIDGNIYLKDENNKIHYDFDYSKLKIRDDKGNVFGINLSCISVNDFLHNSSNRKVNKISNNEFIVTEKLDLEELLDSFNQDFSFNVSGQSNSLSVNLKYHIKDKKVLSIYVDYSFFLRNIKSNNIDSSFDDLELSATINVVSYNSNNDKILETIENLNEFTKEDCKVLVNQINSLLDNTN